MNLRYLAIAVAAIELTSFTVVGYKAYSFISASNSPTDLVQLGTMIHLISSVLKGYVAVQLHEHASCPTARTPANNFHLSKSLYLVTVIGLAVAVMISSFLYWHDGTVAVPNLVQCVAFTMMHWMFQKLKGQESQVERIIDLHAHSNKLE